MPGRGTFRLFRRLICLGTHGLPSSRWKHGKRRLEAAKSGGSEQFVLTEPGDSSKYESVQMWHDNVIDVGRDETYKFIDVVVGEIQGMYQRAGVPLAAIHLGGDEVPDGVWEKSRACDRLAVKGTHRARERISSNNTF